MRPHARAQDLRRPERGRADERDHLGEAERRGAAQHGAGVARILDAVEDDGRRVRAGSRRAAGAATRKAIAAGESRLPSDAIAAPETTATSAAASASARRRGSAHAASVTIACATGACGACPPRGAQMLALEQDHAVTPVGGAVVGELPQPHQQRIAPRRDVGDLGHAPLRTAGRARCAPARSCAGGAGQAPCSRSAFRCSGVE